MYSILSDDKSLVITFCDEKEEPEVLAIAEFIDCYGEHALPKTEEVNSDNSFFDSVKEYYDACKDMVAASGKYTWAAKTLISVFDDDVAEKILKISKNDRYFQAKRDSFVDGLMHRRECLDLQRKYAVDRFNNISRKYFKPMSDRDKEVIMMHLYDEKFRRRLRYRIDKYGDDCKIVSIKELVIEVLKTFEGGCH